MDTRGVLRWGLVKADYHTQNNVFELKSTAKVKGFQDEINGHMFETSVSHTDKKDIVMSTSDQQDDYYFFKGISFHLRAFPFNITIQEDVDDTPELFVT
ncbi:hypothetical protein CHS0354_023009 [Potamilus streckersoni]|uniref:Uncharacterized protein n=1 Tax=Potamilus streckersoni TaxID=2493646 RepID=A0AAE0W2V6_9BIVA|nr:hypothetical protein CHS0354_023009 [Potamilus streckersoni]